MRARWQHLLLTGLAACTVPRPIRERPDGAVDAAVPGVRDGDTADATGGAVDTGDARTPPTDEGDAATCSTPCRFDHARAECRAGVCVIAECDPGYADCAGGAADGCETELASDRSHCGACGLRCGSEERCREGRCVERD